MKRYNDLNSYYKSIFGYRVHKITIDAGLSCPNRDGIIKHGGCIYCNNKGSGNGLFKKGISISKQINNNILKISKRFKVNKFIAYFQSYSNTYNSHKKLKKIWDEILNTKNIVGLAIATRPDCINSSILNTLKQYTNNYLIYIEYGLQSIYNQTLKIINRGHSIECFKQHVKLTKKRGIKICTHLILGLPLENKKLILETADFLSENNIDSIKLHTLYILKNTLIEKLYNSGKYKYLNQNEYIATVCNFIERLNNNIIIERLSSDPNPNKIITPLWALKKKDIFFSINNLLKIKNTWQGKRTKK